jgi:hypothetical protein
MCVHMGCHAIWIYAGAMMMCSLVFVRAAVTHCSSTLLVYREVDKQNMTRNWVVGLAISVAKSVLLRYMGCMKCEGNPKTLCVSLVNEVSVHAVLRW